MEELWCQVAGSGSVLHSDWDESVTEGAAAALPAYVGPGYPALLWSCPDPPSSSSSCPQAVQLHIRLSAALLSSLFRLLASPGLIPPPSKEQSTHRLADFQNLHRMTWFCSIPRWISVFFLSFFFCFRNDLRVIKLVFRDTGTPTGSVLVCRLTWPSSSC